MRESESALTGRQALALFLVFAVGYFFSSLMRGVIATLAPELTREFDLNAGQLGLLAGGYFIGFAVFQLPLGYWLDRHGPRKVLAGFLVLAVVSSAGFAAAQGFVALLIARVLGGIGVCACLMAALTAYRRWFPPAFQHRGNAWMLMVGSLGQLSATLPVQWAVPLVGWRLVFALVGLAFALVIVLVLWRVPREQEPSPATAAAGFNLWTAYQPVLANWTFRRLAPVGLVKYGSVTALQTLWVGPWLTEVTGATPLAAASGLFAVNLTMLAVFWMWGAVTPRLAERGITAEGLLLAGLPVGSLFLAWIAWLGSASTWVHWCVFFAVSSFNALMLPIIGMVFPAAQAGRALSALNLTFFLGTFIWQWVIGLGIDALLNGGLARAEAMRVMVALVVVCDLLAYAWYALNRHRTGVVPA